MAAPLDIAIMWHMHQPCYKDPVKGEYTLPWTCLHGVKDYYDMAAIVAETPGAKAVFNLAPSLLEQIEEYASGRARDPFLLRGQMAPAEMGEEDRLFLLENFFSANRQRMIEPYKRYLELLMMAGDGQAGLAERVRHFRDQDLLDLQVWFFLAWTGEVGRRRYPVLQGLIEKGRNFTAADKALLFETHRAILQGIIPLYRELQDAGKAELAVSPYFHPILPLLCDLGSARAAMPRIALPAMPFRHPEDARSQVRQGIRLFREKFGASPAGMWPSEGAVSDEALAVIAECGLGWTATDEEVLSRSLGGLGPGREALYQPHLFLTGAGRDITLFFRDHALSDLIGFTYSQWHAERAVSDFVSRLQEIRRRSPGCRVVPVILDGENAWEYYPDNGYHFLTRLYGAIAVTPGLQLATFSEVLDRTPAIRRLHHIHPGSWINANYGIWVGHPEENAAWELLARAREAAVAANPQVAAMLGQGDVSSTAGDDTARLICKSLHAAEGSDWFWWYGDDHFSAHSDRFDRLFRNHLMNVYRLLRLDIPRALFTPVKKKAVAGLVRQPVSLVSPTVDGLAGDYFEWLGAGLYDLTKQVSAMHAAEQLLQSFFFCFDRSFIYFRIDGLNALDRIFTQEDRLALHLVLEDEYRLLLTIGGEEGLLEKKTGTEWQSLSIRCTWKIRRICEICIPLEAVNPVPGDKVFAYLTLIRAGEEEGRWPMDAPMLLEYAGPDLESEDWLV